MVVATNHSARCWEAKCDAPGTVWAHFQWWCPDHAPTSTPDPNCTHSLAHEHYGVTVCSWCAGHLNNDAKKGKN